jgi:ATP-dependent RNA helicase RhlE
MDTTSTRFNELGLSQELLDSLERAGFAHPTPIQKEAIPTALQDHDLIGCAQTGTGKTLAFLIPLIEKLRGRSGAHALILCPTREIALQTHHTVEKVGKPLKVHSAVIIGGARMGGQMDALRRHPSIIVATPGRLVDHMERGNIHLNKMEYLVMDEADHMLDLGFLPQIRCILRELPKERQTLMFSATFPREIEQLAHQYLKHPKRIDIARPGTAAEGIEHELYVLEPPQKRAAILALLKDEKESTLVFTRTKIDAEWLSRLLAKEGHSVHVLHADRTQGERTATLEKFKKGEYQILVATDLLARGIDVKGIAHVVNFDIPHNPEDYIHRAGRTARLHAKGKASTLASWTEGHFIEAIEKQLGFPLPRKSLSGIKAFEESPSVKATPFGKIGRRGPRVRLR